MFSGMNMLICQIGVGAGTTTVGDIIVVPFLQYDASTDLGTGTNDWQVWANFPKPGMSMGSAQNANNELTGSDPQAERVSEDSYLYAATPDQVVACLALASTDDTYQFVAGADAYMGQVNFQTQQANADGVWGRADTDMFTNFAIAVTMATLNTNTLDSAANEMTVAFDITDFANAANGLDMTQTSMDSILTFQGTDVDTSSAVAVNWLTGNGLVQFCTTVEGDVLAGATIVAGDDTTDANNNACMAAFDYRIDESNPSVSVWDDDDNAQRSCYFCTGDADGRYKLGGFTLPATTDSLVIGVDAVGVSGVTNQIWAQINTAATSTVYLGANLAAPCSASFTKGSATSISYNG